MTSPAAEAARAEAPLLQVRGVSKRFPGVLALDAVDLDARGGEVLAVIGENGAGKSTLMKVLAGIHPPDAGEILWQGRTVSIGSVRQAAALGIALIHQELNLCDNLSVGANVFLGREERGPLGWFSPREVDRAARPLLDRIGLRVPPSAAVGSLPIGQRQLVEIAKALSQRARLLILDEPTSSLTFEETERLFAVIRDLRDQGVAVVYISHRLAEVEAIADRVLGLRDGRVSGELEGDAIAHRAMVRLMVGRDLEVRPRRHRPAPAAAALDVRRLRTRAWPEAEVSLRVGAGEIVGLAGLVGAGRSELLETLFGARRALGGAVVLGGRTLVSGDLRGAIDAGMALVPEDRKQQGLVLEMSVAHNLTLASLPLHRLWGPFLDAGAEARTAREQMQRLDVRAASSRQPVLELSGGNQQKVVLGKWLARRPRLLLLDEPTRGVDIAAKDEMHRLMEELAGDGVAVLFSSSEMAELLGLADRILVMHEGRIAGELPATSASEERVMELATGAEVGG